jgi:hypothetical protein
MIMALESLASISAIRPSMKLCRSFAASYSAFSERSPCARASAIAWMTLGRSTLSRRCNSAFNSSAPLIVIGIWFMDISLLLALDHVKLVRKNKNHT